ncbi:hypothetical protein [Rhizobium sp. CC-YZS058]|uniref:hypothetical protein n=1 Tax=Rhizobium sp. CC-YZS058 TaxID=3042153 RepID=UPI002B05FCCC|nr:hypothetical protein [Rhizobium sp. CC-YZS058]MEA3535441.1 hypothetical protein [Rhizobium sp. CC-YZS058]
MASTEAFIASIGVNGHVEQAGSAYANPNSTVSAMNYLGVSYLRNHYAETSLGLNNINALANAGIKFDFVPIPHWIEKTVDVAAFIKGLEKFEKAHPGSIAAIEGPNEVNIYAVNVKGVKTIASGAEVQKQLYAAINKSSLLKDKDIYNVSLGSTDANQYKQLGNLSGHTDFANAHAYVMSTTTISAGLDYLIGFAKISAPNKPVVITEAGYTTLDNYWYNGVSHIVQAKYTLNTLASAFDKGVSKTYLYELFDFRPDLTPGSANSHFGLFNADGTPKLAATAIHNMTTILANDSSLKAPVTNASFTYSLKGMPLKGQDMVLSKGNGSVDLIVWSEPTLWNQNTKTGVLAPTTTVTVTFGSVESIVSVYDPLLGKNAIKTYFGVREIKVDISDHPLIIETTGKSAVPDKAASVGGHLVGGTSADVIRGQSSKDVIVGNDGSDKLYGGNGNDMIYGNAGKDLLHGGMGADKLFGGADADTFLFKNIKESTVAASGRDTIYDFEKGDHIDLRAIDANSKASGDQAFAFIGDKDFSGKHGQLRYEADSSGVQVYGDVNGDGKADFAIYLKDVAKLVSGDFYL